VKILIARTDKLGDVVLSLPVFAYLKSVRPEWRVHALVAPGCVPLVENDPHLDAIWTWSDAEIEKLERQLAAERFDAAVLLYYHRPLAALLRRLRIPQRFGPLSKWSSWFLLNRGVWQRRSRSDRHESEHNVDLVRRLVGIPFQADPPRLHLSSGQWEIARRFRQDEAPEGQQICFLHPGMGGSALNWAPQRFAVVANALAGRTGRRVLLTGGEEDAGLIEEIRAQLAPQVEVIAGRYPLREFLGVLAAGDLMIAPSTGPLHMAAALGLAVVGLYPPLPTQRPARWGPRGRDAVALSPDVTCPARLTCFGDRCRHWNCMDGMTTEAVLAAAEKALAGRARGAAPAAAADRAEELP
jgi:heptosyltransferase-3